MKKSARAQASHERHALWRVAWITLAILAGLLVAARLAMPPAIRWYVNRTIDRNPLYDGAIGDVHVHLWRGGYSIDAVRLVKTSGNVPVPFFQSKRIDLQLQWDAMLHGRLVGTIVMEDPEMNFVDADSASQSQTGGGSADPWLHMIKDLYPFKINSAQIRNGSIHFRAFHTNPPVDVYLSELQGSIENLTNIHNETTPLVATVNASGRAMDQARFEYEMRLDPFAYRPTFQLATRLLRLDVTKVNSLARAYGAFDFERGWFDLVVELNVQEGREMKEVHKGLHISNTEFDAFIGDLQATLDKLKVAPAEQKELLAIFESTRPQIVEER